jgi:hypothetical protein
MKQLIYIILFLPSFIIGQQLAFPSAYGAGAYVTGGRGGTVVHVTNLNDSGTGSLREALLMTVPRIIVFDVSGIINLTSILELILENSDVTIAGQTAPQGGITISGKPIQLGGGYGRANQPCNNAIFRYIRFRNGSYTGVADVYAHNGFISVGTNGLILDHCSFSFNDDQAISMQATYGNLTNQTISRCVFSENATGIILNSNASSYDVGNISVLNNLFVHQGHRTPNLNANLQVDIINNIIFNHAYRTTNMNGASLGAVNYISNYLRRGSYTSTVGADGQVQSPAAPSIYTANNYHSALYTTPQLDDRNLWTVFPNGNSTPVNSAYFTTTQHELRGQSFTIKSASEAYTDVLADAGANKYLNADGTYGTYIDSYDTTRINDVVTSTSRDPYNKTWVQPTLPNNTRTSYYGTNQHIPAAFLTDRGVTNTTTVHNDLAPSDYTWMEEFLNSVDGAVSGNITHTLTELQKGRNRFSKRNKREI